MAFDHYVVIELLWDFMVRYYSASAGWQPAANA
jgi:hypothetical protein